MVTFQGRKVLLAEDNLINQKVAQMMLTSLGMVVELASNGQEALDAIKRSQEAKSQFHCVLMDMAMPVMGGVDATVVILYIQFPTFHRLCTQIAMLQNLLGILTSRMFCTSTTQAKPDKPGRSVPMQQFYPKSSKIQDSRPGWIATMIRCGLAQVRIVRDQSRKEHHCMDYSQTSV